MARASERELKPGSPIWLAPTLSATFSASIPICTMSGCFLTNSRGCATSKPGASIFAPQWETCANNCEFYHNPAVRVMRRGVAVCTHVASR